MKKKNKCKKAINKDHQSPYHQQPSIIIQEFVTHTHTKSSNFFFLLEIFILPTWNIHKKNGFRLKFEKIRSANAKIIVQIAKLFELFQIHNSMLYVIFSESSNSLLVKNERVSNHFWLIISVSREEFWPIKGVIKTKFSINYTLKQNAPSTMAINGHRGGEPKKAMKTWENEQSKMLKVNLLKHKWIKRNMHQNM